MAFDNEPARGRAARQHARHRRATLAASSLADSATRAAPAAWSPTSTRTIPEALVLDGPFDVHGSPLWRAGAFVAQSRAAMLVARALAPRAGERVLDLCAAPGGKTTHLAALMEGRGADRRGRAQRRAGRGALASTARAAARGERPRRGRRRARSRGPRARPSTACSSTRRARASARCRRAPTCAGASTPAASRRWRARRPAILAAGAAALRPGGVLVYSTCTISPTENEHVIAAFLDSHPDFSLDDLAAELPALALRAPPPQAPAERIGAARGSC